MGDVRVIVITKRARHRNAREHKRSNTGEAEMNTSEDGGGYFLPVIPTPEILQML